MTDARSRYRPHRPNDTARPPGSVFRSMYGGPASRKAAVLLAVADDLSKPLSTHARDLGVVYSTLIGWMHEADMEPSMWPRKARHTDAPVRLTNTPWDEDETCLRVLEEHPGGATLEAIAEAYGLTRERIRQIEAGALVKLQRRLRALGIEEP